MGVVKENDTIFRGLDYYPFGMEKPGRCFASGEYKYGYQNQEKDDEMKGEGNSINFTFRMYDPRIARFFAVDPLTSKYPHYTPYSFSGNKVIHAIELEGLEEWEINNPDGSKGTINGPFVNQDAAQKMANKSLIGSDGFINNDKIIKKQVSALELGAMSKIDGIILHRTGSTNAESSLSSFKTGIGTHFVVGDDGKIFQTASLNKYTAHIGKIKSKCYETGLCSKDENKLIKGYGWNPEKIYKHEIGKDYPDRYPFNKDAVGIEVVGQYNSTTKAWGTLTSEQIESTSYLVNYLKMAYNLKFADIYTHEQVSYKQAGEGTVVLDAIKDNVQDNTNP
ncbi:MAG: hypothetical protein A3F91_10725 [Flavobacteria bacterium RIFCSPLOWO2_12_FULL_35_11]|nr:MAG: hypothetical protein A3F91_10725 [Flavobacteria bacterium RIFCSPLOWO2_12_FULL_35_11]